MVILVLEGMIIMDNRSVGKHIREARLSKGLTQEQLAEKAGVASSYISVIERCLKTTQLDTFVAICNALGVSADSLLVDVVDAPSPAVTNELSAMLQGQTKQKQLLVLRVAKTIIDS